MFHLSLAIFTLFLYLQVHAKFDYFKACDNLTATNYVKYKIVDHRIGFKTNGIRIVWLNATQEAEMNRPWNTTKRSSGMKKRVAKSRQIGR
jgi:hypothetical protein